MGCHVFYECDQCLKHFPGDEHTPEPLRMVCVLEKGPRSEWVFRCFPSCDEPPKEE